MIVSQHIKEPVPTHFYSMGFKFFLQTLVQVSAAAPFPYFSLFFNKPNNEFFLYYCVCVLMQLFVISLFTVSKYATHFSYFFFWPLLLEGVDCWAPYFFTMSILNFFSAISMACCQRSARNSATRNNSLSSLFSSSSFLS